MAGYGSWDSEITLDVVASGQIVFDQVASDGADLYWVEVRPWEDGRGVIVRRGADGIVDDCLPMPFGSHTAVHEYGGRSFAVESGVIYFSNQVDDRLYRKDAWSDAVALTPAGMSRFADPCVDKTRGRVLWVQEDHTPRDREPINSLVAVDSASGRVEVLLEGSDFYANPRVSPDGSRLAWISWNHPNMPWDDTELWTARFGPNGCLIESRRLAGAKRESCMFPEWAPDGTLCFISDRDGWWRLHRAEESGLVRLGPIEGEVGQPRILGSSGYDLLGDRALCSVRRGGSQALHSFPLHGRSSRKLELPYVTYEHVQSVGARLAFVGASATTPANLVLSAPDGSDRVVVRESLDNPPDPSWISVAEDLVIPTASGDAHGFFYRPTNPVFVGPRDERPPLIVMAHGGPVTYTATALNLDVQFYTSRGFAVLDVNYRGSLGYGRRYREALYGNWGVVDVDDCIAGARLLREGGYVDPQRVVIRGFSAGGFTALAALAFRDYFDAGISFCGVSDLDRFARTTHKFESHYLDHLIGDHSQHLDRYLARSPLHHADGITRPLLLCQGQDDRIVPREQAVKIGHSLRERGVAVALVEFEREGHGNQRAASRRRYYEAELSFLAQVLDIPDRSGAPFHLDNL